MTTEELFDLIKESLDYSADYLAHANEPSSISIEAHGDGLYTIVVDNSKEEMFRISVVKVTK